MRIPNIALRRSKETASATSEQEPLVAPAAQDKKKQYLRTQSGRGLNKWENMLTEEDREVLAAELANERYSGIADDLMNPCSPRGLEDLAAPSARDFRNNAQIDAVAMLYATRPTIFA